MQLMEKSLQPEKCLVFGDNSVLLPALNLRIDKSKIDVAVEDRGDTQIRPWILQGGVLATHRSYMDVHVKSPLAYGDVDICSTSRTIPCVRSPRVTS